MESKKRFPGCSQLFSTFFDDEIFFFSLRFVSSIVLSSFAATTAMRTIITYFTNFLSVRFFNEAMETFVQHSRGQRMRAKVSM